MISDIAVVSTCLAAALFVGIFFGVRSGKAIGYQRGYDTAWVDRQIHDAKRKQPRRSDGRFTNKPRIQG